MSVCVCARLDVFTTRNVRCGRRLDAWRCCRMPFPPPTAGATTTSTGREIRFRRCPRRRRRAAARPANRRKRQRAPKDGCDRPSPAITPTAGVEFRRTRHAPSHLSTPPPPPRLPPLEEKYPPGPPLPPGLSVQSQSSLVISRSTRPPDQSGVYNNNNYHNRIEEYD